MQVALLLCVLAAFFAVSSAFPPPTTCQMSDSDPKPNWASIPKASINLDAAPADRWNVLATEYKDKINTMVNEFVDHIAKLPGQKWENFLTFLEDNQETLLNRLPNNYGDEIRGIQKVTQLKMSSLLAFNLGYEIMGACTSAVAQDINGKTIHGRNLDFGLFLGSNFSSGPNNNFQWTNTDLLRQITVITDFTRAGQVLYTSVSYIGYVGLLTGVRKGAVTVSVDTRFDDNYDRVLKAWLHDPTDEASLLSLALRSQIEDDSVGTSFDLYVNKLAGTRLVAPAYGIIGGPNAGQGVVLTITPNASAPLDIWRMTDANALPADAAQADKFYVLETNYDHWEQPPKIDNRVSSAYDCMDHYIGKEGITKDTMYKMLAAMPNRNRLTTYTAIMDCNAGTLDATLQYCYENACSPW